MENVEVERMTPRELFRGLESVERKLIAAKKAMQAAQGAYGKARQELGEIVRPEKIEMACERWLGAEKDAITAAIGVMEELQAAYNTIGREIDVRRMEIDQEKLRQGIT